MGQPVEHSFEIAAPIDRVWDYFSNPPQVVPCMAGAELVEVLDERTYRGRVGLRLGQFRAQFEGQVHLQEVDPEQKCITLVATGDQVGAVGHAQADIRFSLQELGAQLTQVQIVGDVNIAGRLAQAGGGMIQTVTKFMFDRFSKCVVEQLKVEEETPETAQEERRWLGRAGTAIKRFLERIVSSFR